MKETHQNMTRRRFLSATTAAAVPLLVSSAVLGREEKTSPMNRTTVGFVGVGCLGRGHLEMLANQSNVELIGVSDVDSWRLADGMKIVKRGYKNQKRPDHYAACKPIHEFRDMIGRDDIDAMVFVMGDRWHAAAGKLAAKSGKDLFVEKPCALTVDECLSFSQVVRDNRRISQVGLQQRSDAWFQFACEIVHEGRLGKITHIYTHAGGNSYEIELPAEPVPQTLDWERWLGPAPYRPWNHRFHHLGWPKNVVPWSFCRDFGNGGIADGCVHDLDIVNWGLNMEYLPGPDPDRNHIRVQGKLRPKPVFKTPLEFIPAGLSNDYRCNTWKYPGGVLVQMLNGRIDERVDYLPPGLKGEILPVFGAIFVGDRGWVSVGRRGYIRASSYDLIADCPRRRSVSHMVNFIDCVRTRRETNCPVERGCEATLCSTIGSMAMWLKRPLKWDLNRQEFIDDPEANRLRSRTPRDNWMLL